VDLGFLIGIFHRNHICITLDFVELKVVVLGGTNSGNVSLSAATLCLSLHQTPNYHFIHGYQTQMAGPTPVSALINAATMVTAGIFRH
jgi:hypothetical protein